LAFFVILDISSVLKGAWNSALRPKRCLLSIQEAAEGCCA
jgi:hypothetical protein